MTLRSGLGWLSSSSVAIARARSVLDALRKPGVIDELRFLMLNGAFAERLYPGVTTIMTRARYLVFVPAMYRHLEQSRKAIGKDTDRICRDLQFDLRNALERNETSFIGKEGGRNLIRVPSITPGLLIARGNVAREVLIPDMTGFRDWNFTAAPTTSSGAVCASATTSARQRRSAIRRR